MSRPEFWIIGGPNGAGKTTLVTGARVQFGLPEGSFINPDAITLEYLKEQGVHHWKEAPSALLKETFTRAANDAQRLLENRLERRGTAVIESVLSTTKYCELVDRVVAAGGVFRLIYVALSSAEISRQRVALRVLKGGHDVPADKLEARWARSLELLPWFAVRASQFWIIDNSTPESAFAGKLMVSGSEGMVKIHGIPQTQIRPLVDQFINRFSGLNHDGRWVFELEDPYQPPAE